MNITELENWLLESLSDLNKNIQNNNLGKDTFAEVANSFEELRKDLKEDGDLEENHWDLTLSDFDKTEPSMLFYVGFWQDQTKYILCLTNKAEEVKYNCLNVSIIDCEGIENLIKTNSTQLKELVVPRSTGEYWLQIKKG